MINIWFLPWALGLGALVGWIARGNREDAAARRRAEWQRRYEKELEGHSETARMGYIHPVEW